MLCDVGGGRWALGLRLWDVDFGLWSVISRWWCVFYGLWSVIFGLGLVVCHLWSVPCGFWSIVGGLWSVVSAVWCVVGSLWLMVHKFFLCSGDVEIPCSGDALATFWRFIVFQTGTSPEQVLGEDGKQFFSPQWPLLLAGKWSAVFFWWSVVGGQGIRL